MPNMMGIGQVILTLLHADLGSDITKVIRSFRNRTTNTTNHKSKLHVCWLYHRTFGSSTNYLM